MALCGHCEDIAKVLSSVIAGGYGQGNYNTPVRHGCPFEQLSESSSQCPLCRFLALYSTLENPNVEPVGELFAVHITPVWTLTPERFASASKVGENRHFLSFLHIIVKYDVKSSSTEATSSGEKINWPFVAQVFVLRGGCYEELI